MSLCVTRAHRIVEKDSCKIEILFLVILFVGFRCSPRLINKKLWTISSLLRPFTFREALLNK